MLVYVLVSFSRNPFYIIVCFVILLFVSYSTVSPLLCLLYTLRVLSRFALSRRGGLLFFLGHEQPDTVTKEARIVMTIVLVLSNISFLCVAIYEFVKEFIRDYKHKDKVKRLTQAGKVAGLTSQTQVTPVETHTHNSTTVLVEKNDDEEDGEGRNAGVVEKEKDNDQDNDDTRFTVETSLRVRRESISHSRSTVRQAHVLHAEFHEHDTALKNKQEARQKKQKRHTQLRVLARMKVRQSKTLSKVPMFRTLQPDAIEALLEKTKYKKHKCDDILCTQGEEAATFFIIVSGTCSVQIDMVSSKRRVGTLRELDFFGEGALLDINVEEDDHEHEHVASSASTSRKRNATVIVESENVQVLKLGRKDVLELMKLGVLTNDMLHEVQAANRERVETNRKLSEQVEEE